MEKAGLVRRQRDPADERRVVVMLTEQGRLLRELAFHVAETMSGGYHPEGINELRESVRTLVSILAQRDGKPSAMPVSE